MKVVDYKGKPCLVLETGGKDRYGEPYTALIGVSKIKAVLSNEALCREFLAQYDRPKISVVPDPVSAPNPATPEEKPKRTGLKRLPSVMSPTRAVVDKNTKSPEAEAKLAEIRKRLESLAK